MEFFLITTFESEVVLITSGFIDVFRKTRVFVSIPLMANMESLSGQKMNDQIKGLKRG